MFNGLIHATGGSGFEVKLTAGGVEAEIKLSYCLVTLQEGDEVFNSSETKKLPLVLKRVQ